MVFLSELGEVLVRDRTFSTAQDAQDAKDAKGGKAKTNLLFC